MIASVEGILREREGNRIVVEVGGVGLELLVPARAADSLGAEGARVRLHTYLHVREDVLALYGFAEESERRLFRTLLAVSGVGPKLALAVLSTMDAGELARVITGEQTKTLQTIPGVGKKTAERIVLELKDKIEVERYASAAAPGTLVPRGHFEEAVTALESIGLSRSSALKALEAVDVARLGERYGVGDLVRAALKNL